MTRLLRPHERDIGSFSVRRVLPAATQRRVGPFVFFDHMGPAVFAAGGGMDVRPHPHIGLATVTYLFDGAIVHRDSLGVTQRIEPGDVNWMVAGDGIVHSERTDPADRVAGFRVHGIQTWVGLPRDAEDAPPAFAHHPKATLPMFEESGASLRLIVGTYRGAESPAAVFSPIFYLAGELAAGGRCTVSAEHAERAVYVVEGDVTVDGTPVPAGSMLVLDAGGEPIVAASTAARVMLCGGAPLDGDRILWWNFVASSRERIEAAKERWRAQRFGQVPGETEFIPLPD